jgi:hypothetical protein
LIPGRPLRRSRASKPIPQPRHEREGWDQKQKATLHHLLINPETPERHKKNQFPPTAKPRNPTRHVDHTHKPAYPEGLSEPSACENFHKPLAKLPTLGAYFLGKTA